MIEWARVNYRSDTKEQSLSIVANGETNSYVISDYDLHALAMSIFEALKKKAEKGPPAWP